MIKAILDGRVVARQQEAGYSELKPGIIETIKWIVGHKRGFVRNHHFYLSPEDNSMHGALRFTVCIEEDQRQTLDVEFNGITREEFHGIFGEIDVQS